MSGRKAASNVAVLEAMAEAGEHPSVGDTVGSVDGGSGKVMREVRGRGDEGIN